MSKKTFYRLKAAKMIRDRAKREGMTEVARLSLERIAEMLDEIVRRDGLPPKSEQGEH